VGANKGWKKFEITMVKVDGVVTIVHPKSCKQTFNEYNTLWSRASNFPRIRLFDNF
jgi:hypothetical protein